MLNTTALCLGGDKKSKSEPVTIILFPFIPSVSNFSDVPSLMLQ